MAETVAGDLTRETEPDVVEAVLQMRVVDALEICEFLGILHAARCKMLFFDSQIGRGERSLHRLDALWPAAALATGRGEVYRQLVADAREIADTCPAETSGYCAAALEQIIADCEGCAAKLGRLSGCVRVEGAGAVPVVQAAQAPDGAI